MDLMPPRRSFPEALTQRVECWVYGEGSGGGAAQKSSSESGEIGRRDIAHWLGEPPRKSLVDNKTPVAGLRLICHRQVVSIERPFDEPTFRAIHAALGLPERHEYLTALNAGACGKYVGAAENPSELFSLYPQSPSITVLGVVPYFWRHPSLLTQSQVFIYHRFNNNLTISAVIKYDSASNITRGYILTGPRISIDKVCDEIMSQFPYINHPLLIPTVLVELTAAGLMSELYQIERFLARSETMSLDNWKFDNWELGNVTPNILDGEEHKKKNNEKKDEAANGHEKDSDDKGDQNGTPGENRLAGAAGEVKIKLEPAPSAAIQQAMENFSSTRDLALWLGKISQRYAYMKVTVQSSILMAEFTLREIDNMEASAVTPDQFRRLAKVTNGECLRHRVELLLSNLHHMVLFTALDQRIQAQQNIVSPGQVHSI